MSYANIEDRRNYARAHYARNKPAYKARARLHTDISRAETRIFVQSYLAEHPCVDCGEDDPIVLEFDHRNRAEKLFNIADHKNTGHSIESVQREIAKCDVRCANCHRRKTHQERTGSNLSCATIFCV